METSRTYEVYVAATPDSVWHAFTDPDKTEKYYFGTRVQTDWNKGSPVRYVMGDQPFVEGEIVEIEQGRHLVTTFVPLFLGEGMPASTVRWDVGQREGDAATRVALTHSDFNFSSPG